eukprot:TRINITY_DN6060_c4_g1_i2.p1 TRINITY_DN6060_c4_g1~~TRINITY_DN6060_c4_g1_i2.p1  ORF type:complete len:191 (+),score=35.66 TRINITY_DN6060_c4_g1_i2:85-657(+)
MTGGSDIRSCLTNNYSEKTASVITASKIRYHGVIHSITPETDSLLLRDVTIFGTEDRPAEKVIPKSPSVYSYVNLTADNIKHLTLFEYCKKEPKPALVLAKEQQQQQQQQQQQLQQQTSSVSSPTNLSNSSTSPTSESNKASYLDAVRGKEQPAQIKQSVQYSNNNVGKGGYKGRKGSGKGGKSYTNRRP